MPEIKVDVNVEVFCGRCGKGLCSNTSVKRDSFYVDPCGDCLKEEHDDSYKAGKDDGYSEGLKEAEEIAIEKIKNHTTA